MKKSIIVLLIAVLVAGVAFADLKSSSFHGYAGIDFGVDFDDHEWGFENYTFAKYTFKFEFDSAAVAIGADHQTDVWAELDAAAEAYIQLTAGDAGNYAANAADIAPGAKYTAKITKANIHVGDITFGILNAGSAKDFATRYAKIGGVNNVVKEAGTAPGFTVSYKLDDDKTISGGFGAEGTWDPDNSDNNTHKIFAHIEAPTFKFAEDKVTVDAAAYAFLIDKNTFLANIDATTGKPKAISNFGGGFKAAYKEEKLSADVAFDAQVFAIPETAVTEKKNQFVFEAAANATYDFVTLNVYAAPGALWNTTVYAGDYAEAIKLDAMLSAAYTFDLNEDIALKVTGYVEGRDTLVKALALEIGSTQATTVKAFTIELSEKATLDNLANDADVVTKLEASEKVTYTAEKFVAYESVAAKFDFSADEALKALVVKAGISSEAIVEGAELALDYATQANKIAFKDSKGAVTASCTISF